MTTIVTTQSTRSKLSTPFYVWPKDVEDLRNTMVSQNKILETSSTMSEDGLTNTTIWKFVDQDAYNEWQNNPIIVAAQGPANTYHQTAGIARSRTVENV